MKPKRVVMPSWRRGSRILKRNGSHRGTLEKMGNSKAHQKIENSILIKNTGDIE
jgi:hypothetical protein